jgi:Domain of unknown function (DUF4282)
LFPRRKIDAAAPPQSHAIDPCQREVQGAARAACGGFAKADLTFVGQAFAAGRRSYGGGGMAGISDLFQWERFVTPTVIKVFYWLAVVISVLLGLAGAVSSLASMAFNPFVGMIFLIASLLGACMGIVVARIIAEFVLIVFRINEHLGAIRNRGTPM